MRAACSWRAHLNVGSLINNLPRLRSWGTARLCPKHDPHKRTLTSQRFWLSLLRASQLSRLALRLLITKILVNLIQLISRQRQWTSRLQHRQVRLLSCPIIFEEGVIGHLFDCGTAELAKSYILSLVLCFHSLDCRLAGRLLCFLRLVLALWPLSCLRLSTSTCGARPIPSPRVYFVVYVQFYCISIQMHSWWWLSCIPRHYHREYPVRRVCAPFVLP